MNAAAPIPGDLRKFGFVLAAAFIVVFGLALPWLFGHAFPTWPYYVAGVLAAVALVLPRALAPVHRGWMAMGHVLGWINTRIILGALFFVLVVPIGFVLRLLGKHTIARARDPGAESYRVASAQKRDRRSMEKPF